MGELEAAAFRAVLNSRLQRRRRLRATAAIALKHALRGLLFLWPAYLVLFAALTDWISRLYLLPAVPGVLISLYIYVRGVRKEYRQRIRGKLLPEQQFSRQSAAS